MWGQILIMKFKSFLYFQIYFQYLAHISNEEVLEILKTLTNKATASINIPLNILHAVAEFHCISGSTQFQTNISYLYLTKS